MDDLQTAASELQQCCQRIAKSRSVTDTMINDAEITRAVELAIEGNIMQSANRFAQQVVTFRLSKAKKPVETQKTWSNATKRFLFRLYPAAIVSLRLTSSTAEVKYNNNGLLTLQLVQFTALSIAANAVEMILEVTTMKYFH